MKKWFYWIGGILTIFLLFFIFYLNNLQLVNKKTVEYYYELKNELIKEGYKDNLIVISGKRASFYNAILVYLNGAAKGSRHQFGEAIDILVLDVNDDGKINDKDVDIVSGLCDKKIIKSKGGVGTYKKDWNFFNKQMVHIDCRGFRARWNE